MLSEDVNPAAHTAAGVADRAPPVVRPEHVESSVTRILEQQAAKIPSHVFLSASLMSMGASALCELRGNERLARFVGMWAAPLLIMGVYNKLVKTFGPA